MDEQQTEAPPFWREELARSDADIARGDVLPAATVHDRLRVAISVLESEIASAGL